MKQPTTDPRAVAAVAAGIVSVDPLPGQTDQEAGVEYATSIFDLGDGLDSAQGIARLTIHSEALARFAKLVTKAGGDVEQAMTTVRQFIEYARIGPAWLDPYVKRTKRLPD